MTMNGRMGADRNLTSAAQRSEKGAFRRDALTCGFVIEFLGQLKCGPGIVAGLNRQRTLTDGGTHDFHGNQFRNAIRPAQAPQPGGREYNGIVLAFVELTQARIHISAQHFDFESGVALPQLRCAAQGTGADRSTS